MTDDYVWRPMTDEEMDDAVEIWARDLYAAIEKDWFTETELNKVKFRADIREILVKLEPILIAIKYRDEESHE
jgi:hypothetical protein